MAFVDPLVGPSGTGNAWDTRRTFDAFQKQTGTSTIRSFDSATARDDAISVPVEGQLCYRSDIDTYQWYNGSTWVTLVQPGAWQSWTPTIVGSTTNPTLGTGAIQEGFYCQVGKLVVAQAYIVFGTSGVNAGSGEYSISLPLSADTSTNRNHVSGTFYASDASASVVLSTGLVMTGTTTYSGNGRLFYSATYPTGGLTSVASTAPWTWAASDSLRALVIYRTA